MFKYIEFDILFSKQKEPSGVQGPVVQSNVSLTTPLSKSFVKCFRKYYDNTPVCFVAKCKVHFVLLQFHTLFQ